MKPGHHDGYVLPIALAAIMAISLIAAIAAAQVQKANQAVFQLSRHTATEAELISAEQTALFYLMTEPISREGIEIGGEGDPLGLFNTPRAGSSQRARNVQVIRVDATPYLVEDSGGFVRLIADQTLLNLSTDSPGALETALELLGEDPALTQRLFAQVADYEDSDDLRRIGGAEADDYPEGSAGPANRPLRDSLEVCSIPAWRELSLCGDRGRLLLLTGVRQNSRLNPRLITPFLRDALTGEQGSPISASMSGMPGRPRSDEERTSMSRPDEIVSFAMYGRPELDQASDPFDVVTLPGPRFTIVAQSEDGLHARATVYELTPSNVFAPFTVHSKYAIGGSYAGEVLFIDDAEQVDTLPRPAGNSSSGIGRGQTRR